MFCTKCGTDLPDDAQFCLKCGHALTGPPAKNVEAASVPDTVNEPPVTSPATTDAPTVSPPTEPNPNIGTIVFAAFAVLSLVVSFAKGIVPIFIIEAGLWAGLAWYWHRKKPKSQAATAIVLLLALVVTAAEGYLVLRKFGGPSYTYLQQGKSQVRVDSVSGRTDRLTLGGWVPVSFDRPPEQVPAGEWYLDLSNGKWDDILNEVCFDVSNSSNDYVVQDFTIFVSFDPKPARDNVFNNAVTLTNYSGVGLLDKGKSSRFCGAAPKYPNGSTWTYELTSVRGWKQ